jgi:hypothetical protein
MKRHFLNQYGCRLPRYEVGYLQKLKKLIQKFESHLITLQTLKTEEVRFDISLGLGDKSYSLSQIIEDAYGGLSSGEINDIWVNKFRYTAASKFMHMTCPDLLIMVDSKLGSYLQKLSGVRKYHTKEGYIGIHIFIKNELEELLRDVMDNRGLTRKQAKEYLRQKDEGCVGSLPRLVEKHYFYLSQ